MRRFYIVPLLVFLAPVPLLLSLYCVPTSPAAVEQAPEPKPNLAANAALKYWQAFAVMPPLDKDQEKILEDCNKVPLNAAALKLIETSEMSRTYLHRGAKVPCCDWSLDYTDGINLLLPHISKARTLARLTCLHARQLFEQGRFSEGVDDMAAVLVLASQVDPDPSLISTLVRLSIEATAIETLALYLPQFDAAALKSLADRLATLPTGATTHDKLVAENKYLTASIVKLLRDADKKKEGSWRDALKVVLGLEGRAEMPAEVKAIDSLDKAIKLLEDLDPAFEQQAKLVALPREDFDAQYPDFIKKARAANPLAGACLPDVARFMASERKNKAQMLLLKTAIAVVQGGPDKVKESKDPFGSGPFEYRAVGKGFELKSKLIFREQPVTLQVGQGKKE